MAALFAAVALAAGCASARADTRATSTVAPSTVTPSTVTPSTVTPSTGTVSTTDATEPTDETLPSDSVAHPPTSDPDGPATASSITSEPPTTPFLRLPNVENAFTGLASANAAASLTIWRDHAPIYRAAWGLTTSGVPMTADSPLVIASVSKLVTALTITRLIEAGDIEVDAPVPWDRLFIAHDPAWDTVTVRELLDHTSGMPKMQASWTGPPGSCAIPLGAALSLPPTLTRGTWTYSNGNYCALGLLVEAITGERRDDAARDLLFAPIDVTGPHLTTDGLHPGDGPHPADIARLERLGGAGTWMASTDDLAAMLDSIDSDDLGIMRYPGIMIDQYGWGHTGTVDGAKSCAWVVEGGRTIVVATVAGDRPATGGKVCDEVIPAVAADLGFWVGKPVRYPA